MSVKCYVPNCFIYKDTKYSGITFHKFPINPEARENWIKALPFKIDKLSKSAALCSLHFHPKDIRRNSAKTYIVKGAIPSIFRDWLEVKKHLVREDGTQAFATETPRVNEAIVGNEENLTKRIKQDTVSKWVLDHAKTIDDHNQKEKGEDTEESQCEEEEEEYDYIVLEIKSNCSKSSLEGRSADPIDEEDDNEPGTDYPPNETPKEVLEDHTNVEPPTQEPAESAEVVSSKCHRKSLRWAMDVSGDEKILPHDCNVLRKLQILRHHMKARQARIGSLKSKLYRAEVKYQKLVKTLRVVPSKFVKIHDVEEI